MSSDNVAASSFSPLCYAEVKAVANQTSRNSFAPFSEHELLGLRGESVDCGVSRKRGALSSSLDCADSRNNNTPNWPQSCSPACWIPFLPVCRGGAGGLPPPSLTPSWGTFTRDAKLAVAGPVFSTVSRLFRGSNLRRISARRASRVE